MKNLIIDIGNSRIKAAIFRENRLVKEFVLEDMEGLLDILQEERDFQYVLVSSVKWAEEELRERLPVPFLFLDRNTPLPILNRYRTPESLGVDRTAAVIGGMVMQPGHAILTIDLGTCITFDFLNEDAQYLGGAISPGIQMRFQAMYNQTARLPLVSFSSGVPLVGDSTETCMQSGVYHGVRWEMQGVIDQYCSLYPDLKVFICGGDSKYFESLIKDYIFVIPNLVLYGLNRILIYNADKN